MKKVTITEIIKGHEYTLKLKPCPFCGSVELAVGITDVIDREGLPCHIYCDDCGARSGCAYLPNELMLMQDNWNNRHE